MCIRDRITQIRPLKAADGSIMEANGRKITGTAVIEPDIARFRQYVYTDPGTGNSMPYNLYLPEQYAQACIPAAGQDL